MPHVKSPLAALAAAAALAFSMSALGADEAAFGPEPGANLADVLVAPDAMEMERTVAELAGENGLVLYFSRSVDWCPFCKAQALDINEHFDDFAERGYNVAILTTDAPRKLARYERRSEPRTTMLADPDSTIITALGLLDPSFPEGHRSHGLPYPTTLVLSPDATVEAKLFLEETLGENGAFRERVTVDDVLGAIDALGAEG